MLTAEGNRLLVARAPVRRDLEHHIRFPERRLREADDDLHTAVKASPVWRVKDDRLQSVPEVGRAAVRAGLYMAGLVASRCHPVIRALLRPPPRCGQARRDRTRYHAESPRDAGAKHRSCDPVAGAKARQRLSQDPRLRRADQGALEDDAQDNGERGHEEGRGDSGRTLKEWRRSPA
jgi:hypothetical protein